MLPETYELLKNGDRVAVFFDKVTANRCLKSLEFGEGCLQIMNSDYDKNIYVLTRVEVE